MPVRYNIMPRHDLIVIRYDGHAGVAETEAAVQACASNPDFKPTMRHLFDLSRVTSVDSDFTRFFAFQAGLLDIYGSPDHEMHAVFYAPTPSGRRMANMAIPSWGEVENVIMLVLDDEAQALEFLGLKERKISEFTAKTA